MFFHFCYAFPNVTTFVVLIMTVYAETKAILLLDDKDSLQSFSPPLSVQSRGVDLSCVRSCVVVGEERPRLSLLSSFSALFSPLGLGSHTISTSFGCRVNPIICLQVSSLHHSSILTLGAHAQWGLQNLYLSVHIYSLSIFYSATTGCQRAG